MASFSVTSSSSTLALGPAQPGGAFDLRVTNQSGFTLTVRVQAESQQNPPFLKADLVAADGGALDSASPTVELKANAWVAYRLRVTAEPKLAPGTYTFLVKAINTADTDSDIGLSETLSVTIPEVRKPPLPSWLAFAVVGALLVIGGTVAAILATRDPGIPKEDVPKFIGMTHEEMLAYFSHTNEHRLFSLGKTDEQEDPAAPGTVIGQDPPPDAPAEINSDIDLILAKAKVVTTVKVPVPEVVGLLYADADKKIRAVGLTTTRKTVTLVKGKPSGQVTAQSPANGTLEKGKAVELTVSAPLRTSVEAVQASQQLYQRALTEGWLREGVKPKVLGK